jgi:hypothetical protein
LLRADFCEDEDGGELIEDMDVAGVEGVPELSQIQGYIKRSRKKGT